MTWGRVRTGIAARRSGIAMIAAPLLILIALVGWAFSSAVGSAPDDDFHLVSIWCAGDNPDQCIHEEGEGTAIVPEAVADAATCFKFDPDESAACQDELDFTAPPNTETERGNFVGGYPPLFYSVMNLFVGPDVHLSVILMRLVNILIFVGFAALIYTLLPEGRRPILIWSWALTTVPLGLFVIASTNPSTWAITGIGLGWIALAGYFESDGWKKVGLGASYAVLSILAAGSRGDAAVYAVLATAAVVILTARPTKKYGREAILPIVVAVTCFAMFRLSRPIDVATQGLQQPGSGGPASGNPSGFAGVAYNLLEVPSIWTGIWGNGWGLGWLDTSMPAVVWLGALLAFATIAAVVVRRPGWRKIVVLTGGVAVLWFLPTAVLVAAGDVVGENVQPRYLLPLIILFAGVLLWPSEVRTVAVPKLHYVLVASVLAAAQAIALFLNTARYVSGFDDLSWNLNADIEWWWGSWLSPMVNWVLASIAYGVALFLILQERRIPLKPPPTSEEPPPDDTADRVDAVQR